MVDFAGWSMPVQFSSIIEEHRATRNAAGLFDISHMGRLRFDGADAAGFLDGLLTRRTSDLRAGRIRYSLVTREDGGTLDDVLVYHLEEPDGESFYMMVVNASNREKILAWVDQHLPAGLDVAMEDQTYDWAMIAVQGPLALPLVQPLVAEFDLNSLKYYAAATVGIWQTQGILSRTGYTGEDGCELIVPAEAAEELWQLLVARGSDVAARPAGLGARDTLRLEAGMPLYGHELSEEITPIQAGLHFAVDLENRNFPGSEALAAARQDPNLPRRVGLTCEGRRPAREGYSIVAGGDRIGEVTSGTFSPTFEQPIAMGYVGPQFARPQTQVAVDVRGQLVPATIVELPFYRRSET